jgi:Domain of unknown function (DUF6285)
MMDQPSAVELVKAVQAFLETRAIPELKGHTAFHARVAANALAIVARELEQGPRAAESELIRLRTMLGMDGDLEALNRELCRRIRDGAADISAPAMAEHLRLSTVDKVRIDQPNYSGLKI